MYRYNDFIVNVFMICNFVVFTIGSIDGRIYCWNIEIGVKVVVMNVDYFGFI